MSLFLEALRHQADYLGLASREEPGEQTSSGPALEQFVDRARDGRDRMVRIAFPPFRFPPSAAGYISHFGRRNTIGIRHEFAGR